MAGIVGGLKLLGRQRQALDAHLDHRLFSKPIKTTNSFKVMYLQYFLNL
jgi:hypothetical protein